MHQVAACSASIPACATPESRSCMAVLLVHLAGAALSCCRRELPWVPALPAGPVMADLLNSMMQPHLQQHGQPAAAEAGAAASAGLHGLAPRWAASAPAARPLGQAQAPPSSAPGLAGMGQPGGLSRAAGQAGPLPASAGRTGASAAPGWPAAVRPQQGPVRPQLQGRGRGRGRGRRPAQSLSTEALARPPQLQSLGPGQQQQRLQASRGADGLQALVEQARRQHPARFGAGLPGAPAAAAAEPEDADMLR